MHQTAECRIDQVGAVDDILRFDPARMYSAMDLDTRTRYLQAVDELAERSDTTALEVARRAIRMAAAWENTGHETIAFRQRHVGYYLIDRGRAALEEVIGYQPSWRERLTRVLLNHATSAYLSAIGLLTFGIVMCVMAWTASISSLAVAIAAGVLALIPASEVAVQFVNYCVTTQLSPHRLPKLDFRTGIPDSHATMVVMPCLLLNEREVAGLLERLEQHALANSEANLSFALLTDFRDASEAVAPSDDTLLTQAREGIRTLNERHRKSDLEEDRFFLFHRARQWNSAEQVWMGWERKRGKLLEFNRLLRGATDTSYVVQEGRLADLSKIRYVITLDADTQLPYGTAHRLVGTLAHPLNRPEFRAGPEGLQIMDGYALLQPRVSVSLSNANRSWYSRLFGNGEGFHPYVAAFSEVYQDSFHEGCFIGKGIYDVTAFQAVVDEAFPDDLVLSHDLIEGCHARVGLVTDIAFVDGFPTRYDADARRQHRWVRGDWQLIPWLRNRVPTSRGWRKNPLSVISRWKIFDNLRRSLVPVALLLLLSAGWTVLPGSAWLWTAGALSVLAFPMTLELTCLMRHRLRAARSRKSLRRAGTQVLRALARTALAVTLLPHRAQSMLDAIVRSQVRLWVTRQKLLEWECAAATEQRLNGNPFRNLLREMWFSPTLAIALVALALAGGLNAIGPAVPFVVAWFCSPLIAAWISRPLLGTDAALTKRQRRRLQQIAKQTWIYFEKVVGPEDHWLPPDNVQEQPGPKIAHRTSPTNEGLFLVSALAACDLGFLRPYQLVRLLESNLDTWERLEQHRGHHFNWYDTVTLRPLPPRYVSTVDSGNLVACLLTLRQGLIALAAEEFRPLRARFLCLADRCERLARETDFQFLFDPDRRLFRIGYNLDRNEFDRGHYDLLASEARLASYVAIAKGDVDHHHWFDLGRRLTLVDGRPCLLSWGGGMFEFLMPGLFHRNVAGSLLDATCRAAVAKQVEYGRQRRVPWGVSESTFASLNDGSDYCYQAFGVPGLGMKDGLARELVVAPYATALALSVNATAAARNFRRLAREGAFGPLGFYDAIDFTAERLPNGQRSSPVRCYMTHHQGMSFVALANCLLDGIMQRRFHAHPAIRAAELLLQERVPDAVT